MADGTLPATTPAIKAFSYLRLSTKDQIEGDGERRQLEAVQRYAERNGLVLDDSLRDLGKSGYTGKNLQPGAALHKFLEMVKNGRVLPGSYLLVEDFDRISRQPPMEAIEVIRTLCNAGIVIVTLIDGGQVYTKQRFDHDTGAILTLTMKLSMAYGESFKKSGRVGEVWRQKKIGAADGPITTSGPNWLRGIKTGTKRDAVRHWEPIPRKVTEAKQILTMLSEGMGVFKAAQATGWSRSSVYRLLRNDWALGHYQPTSVNRLELDENGKLIRNSKGERLPVGDSIPDYYPNILEDDPGLLQRARDAVEGRRNRGARGRKGRHFSNLFTGLLRCPCGGTLRYKVKGNGGKLMCSRQLDRADCPHTVMNSRGATWIDYGRFESAFIGNIGELWVALAKPGEDAAVKEAAAKLAASRKELAALEAKMARWTDKLKAMDVPADNALWRDAIRMGDEVTRRQKEVEGAERDLDRLRRDCQGETPAEAIDRVRAEMANLSGAALYRARARLAEEVGRVTQGIVLHPSGAAMIRLRNGMTVHLIAGKVVKKATRRAARIVPVKKRIS